MREGAADDAGEDDEDTDFALYGGWAAFNIPLGGSYGIQIEGFGEGTTSDNSDEEEGEYQWSAGGGLHAYWRDPTRGLFTPALDGPNPQRSGNRNNVGDVWVVAVHTPAGGGTPMRARAHLVVTVPLYMRWDFSTVGGR